MYGIFFSLFLLFNCFAVNQWLQYKQVGKWSDYLIGERTYITLVARREEPARMADLRLHARIEHRQLIGSERHSLRAPDLRARSCP